MEQEIFKIYACAGHKDRLVLMLVFSTPAYKPAHGLVRTSRRCGIHTSTAKLLEQRSFSNRLFSTSYEIEVRPTGGTRWHRRIADATRTDIRSNHT